MDFFEHQEAARGRTRLLVVLYLLAVAVIVAAVYLAVVVIFQTGRLWQPELLAVVAPVTLGLIALGTLFKVAQLARGGQAVAELLGGRRVDPGTTDLDERRLLNVVEEMAIASGTPVPSVYVLDGEPGINAFAAGRTPSDAVVAVTRGTLDLLSRDELQGVVAHEFSHILNGDMRLNLRLMGVLFGILVLAVVGYQLFRTSWYMGGGRRRGRRRGGDGLGMALLLLGLALTVIGYVGVFFARLIKAAVSRQREFLADAAAVQFTRDPGGIAGALKKIGGYRPGSQVQSVHAEEASHLFFAAGVSGFLSRLVSTHPPLVERIRRIEPGFDGRFPEVSPEVEAPPTTGRRVEPGPPPDAMVAVRPEEVTALAGSPRPEHVAYASALLDALPTPLAQAAHEPYGARAVVYALILDDDPAVRRGQLERLERHADPLVYAETERLAPLVAATGRLRRLPLAELCLPALRQLSERQYQAFRTNVAALVEADRVTSLFEYALQRMLVRRLERARGEGRPGREIGSLAPLRPAATVLLSTLAHLGHAGEAESRRAFEWAMGELFPGSAPAGSAPAPMPGTPARLAEVDRALGRLAAAAPGLQRRLLTACVTCLAADGKLTPDEAELLRAVADALELPLPPLLAATRAPTPALARTS